MVGGPQCSYRCSLRARWRSSTDGGERSDCPATRRDPGTFRSGCRCLAERNPHNPVVFVNVSDPIGAGFITSLARPGSNFTGVLHYEVGTLGKWLEMLKEIAPTVAHLRCLVTRRAPSITISCGQARRRHNRSRSNLCPLRSECCRC